MKQEQISPANEWFLKAEEHERLNEREKAKDCYYKAQKLYAIHVQTNQHDSKAFFNLGVCYKKAEDYKTALFCFNKVNGEKYQAIIHKHKGDCYSELGQYKDAMQSYHLIPGKDNDTQVLDNIAWQHLNLAQYKEAFECYGKSDKLAPKDAKFWLDKANVLKQSPIDRTTKHAPMKMFYAKAYDSLYQKAEQCIKKGKPGTAKRCYVHIHKIIGDNKALYDENALNELYAKLKIAENSLPPSSSKQKKTSRTKKVSQVELRINHIEKLVEGYFGDNKMLLATVMKDFLIAVRDGRFVYFVPKLSPGLNEQLGNEAAQNVRDIWVESAKNKGKGDVSYLLLGVRDSKTVKEELKKVINERYPTVNRQK